jgi:hypothetical protein
MLTLDKAIRRAQNMSKNDGPPGIGYRRVRAQALRPRFNLRDPYMPILQCGRGLSRLACASGEIVGQGTGLLPLRKPFTHARAEQAAS